MSESTSDPISIVLRHKSNSPDPTLPTLAVMMPVAPADGFDPFTELASLSPSACGFRAARARAPMSTSVQCQVNTHRLVRTT
jgi:hypothetical protein